MASASRGLIPKNVGVELARVVEESALARRSSSPRRPGRGRAARPGPSRGRRGSGPTASTPVGDQPPQVLRGVDAAGVAAAHRHDGDRLVGCGTGDGRRSGRGCRAPGPVVLGAQVRGDGDRGRVVEGERGRQRQPGGGGEPFAQLGRGQRVEAQLLEGQWGSIRSARPWPRTTAALPRTSASSSARVAAGASEDRGAAGRCGAR